MLRSLEFDAETDAPVHLVEASDPLQIVAKTVQRLREARAGR